MSTSKKIIRSRKIFPFQALPLELLTLVLEHVRDIVILERLRVLSRWFRDNIRSLPTTLLIPMTHKKRNTHTLDTILSKYTHIYSLETHQYLSVYPKQLKYLKLVHFLTERISESTPSPQKRRNIPYTSEDLSLDTLILSVDGSEGIRAVHNLIPTVKYTLHIRCNANLTLINIPTTLIDLSVDNCGVSLSGLTNLRILAVNRYTDLPPILPHLHTLHLLSTRVIANTIRDFSHRSPLLTTLRLRTLTLEIASLIATIPSICMVSSVLHDRKSAEILSTIANLKLSLGKQLR